MTHKSRKNLSTKSQLSQVLTVIRALPNQLKGSGVSTITLADCIMSAIGMFSMKYSSLLSFNNAFKQHSTVAHNLKALFFVKSPPSDTYMRERLDEVDPKRLRKVFTKLFSQLQRGKVLELFKYLNSYYIISIDGTCFFSSKSVHCKNCCVKNHRDGSTTYHHNMLAGSLVHPHMNTVIPLAPEVILKEDGATKNGSEQRAASRFIKNLKREHPHLNALITADSLHSKGPFIKELTKAGYKFILNAKPGDHKSLFEFVKGICKSYKIKRNGISYTYRYVNNVPLNDANQDISVNFLECLETSAKKKTTFTWITNIKITEDNIHQLMEGGRARWKIENETFNTLKTQGYQFEHNFGHGKNNLSTVFAMLMMVAFLVNQTEEMCDALFQAALKKEGKKKYLWEKMRSLFFNFLIESWEALWNAIAHGFDPPSLTYTPG